MARQCAVSLEPAVASWRPAQPTQWRADDEGNQRVENARIDEAWRRAHFLPADTAGQHDVSPSAVMAPLTPTLSMPRTPSSVHPAAPWFAQAQRLAALSPPNRQRQRRHVKREGVDGRNPDHPRPTRDVECHASSNTSAAPMSASRIMKIMEATAPLRSTLPLGYTECPDQQHDDRDQRQSAGGAVRELNDGFDALERDDLTLAEQPIVATAGARTCMRVRNAPRQ